MSDFTLSHPPLGGIHHIPGGEVVIRAYDRLTASDLDSEHVSLLLLYKSRLSMLGFELPDTGLSPLSIKLSLYERLARDHADPYATFKAMEQRLLKFMVYLERESLRSDS